MIWYDLAEGVSKISANAKKFPAKTPIWRKKNTGCRFLAHRRRHRCSMCLFFPINWFDCKKIARWRATNWDLFDLISLPLGTRSVASGRKVPSTFHSLHPRHFFHRRRKISAILAAGNAISVIEKRYHLAPRLARRTEHPYIQIFRNFSRASRAIDNFSLQKKLFLPMKNRWNPTCASSSRNFFPLRQYFERILNF